MYDLTMFKTKLKLYVIINQKRKPKMSVQQVPTAIASVRVSPPGGAEIKDDDFAQVAMLKNLFNQLKERNPASTEQFERDIAHVASMMNKSIRSAAPDSTAADSAAAASAAPDSTAADSAASASTASAAATATAAAAAAPASTASAAAIFVRQPAAVVDQLECKRCAEESQHVIPRAQIGGIPLCARCWRVIGDQLGFFKMSQHDLPDFIVVGGHKYVKAFDPRSQEPIGTIDCHGSKCRHSLEYEDTGIWCEACHGEYDRVDWIDDSDTE